MRILKPIVVTINLEMPRNTTIQCIYNYTVYIQQYHIKICLCRTKHTVCYGINLSNLHYTKDVEKYVFNNITLNPTSRSLPHHTNLRQSQKT